MIEIFDIREIQFFIPKKSIQGLKRTSTNFFQLYLKGMSSIEITEAEKDRIVQWVTPLVGLDTLFYKDTIAMEKAKYEKPAILSN